MDHLRGEACAPTGKQAMEMNPNPPPVVTRGMVTKLAKDNQAAKEAGQRMRNSTVYKPGTGFMCGIGSPSSE